MGYKIYIIISTRINGNIKFSYNSLVISHKCISKLVLKIVFLLIFIYIIEISIGRDSHER